MTTWTIRIKVKMPDIVTREQVQEWAKDAFLDGTLIEDPDVKAVMLQEES